jgi:hypothetical protein
VRSSVRGVEISDFLTFFCVTDNGPKITKAIKGVLKDDYNYDSTVRPLFCH